ncbi:hypothetical protein Tco_0614509 [Tanacetum coccineum]
MKWLWIAQEIMVHSVLPKFDMHIYTSELTLSELKTAFEEYCIPLDLHPRLPHSDMTMNKLLSRNIRLYIEQLEQGVISMDIFLKLPTWTGTVVSRGDPILKDQHPELMVTPPLAVGVKIPELTAFQKNLEKPNSKIVAARKRKEKQNLAKAEAKRDSAGDNEGPKKKQKVQKHHESIQSGLEEILSVIPLHQATSEVAKEPTPSTDVAKDTSHVEKEVVDLSGNTRVPTPPVATAQPSPHTEHHDTYENAAFDGHKDEPVNNRYVPNWGLCNNLRVCTFRACRELVSHLATLAKDEFVGNLLNVEVVSRAYQTLGLSLQRSNQNNEGLTQKLTLLDNAHSECPSREKELLDRAVQGLARAVEEDDYLKPLFQAGTGDVDSTESAYAKQRGLKANLERERDEWMVTASNQVEKIHSLEKDLEPKTQQLKVAKEKIGGKVVDSYGLPMSELLKVSPDAPFFVDREAASSAAAEDAAQQPPSSPPKILADTPFGTTT